MPLGMEVGLGRGDIVLDGYSAASPQIGAQPCACWTSKEQLFEATEECRALT